MMRNIGVRALSFRQGGIITAVRQYGHACSSRSFHYAIKCSSKEAETTKPEADASSPIPDQPLSETVLPVSRAEEVLAELAQAQEGLKNCQSLLEQEKAKAEDFKVCGDALVESRKFIGLP